MYTVGGYHKSFERPTHYPTAERLSIEWKCDDWVNIRGEYYFAITPKAVMAGGSLSVTPRMGNLQAWFNAWLDMLIEYPKFKFKADGGVMIGISYTMDLLFVSTNITHQVGATLHVEGTPVHGTVHVEFWVFGFDINFGDWSKPPIERISLAEFCSLAMRATTAQRPGSGITEKPSGAPGHDTIPDVDAKNRDQCHSFTASSGLVPTKSTQTPKTNDPWTVRSGPFEFAVASLIPLSKLKIDGNNKPVDNEAPIYAKPMKKETALSSEMSVQVFRKEARSANGVLDPGYEKTDWRVSPNRQGLPKSMWSKCKQQST